MIKILLNIQNLKIQVILFFLFFMFTQWLINNPYPDMLTEFWSETDQEKKNIFFS